jgi:transcriptional regulator with XRE-family HTH domain
MSLGPYLRQIREERQLSLRDVERLAKEKELRAEVSSGYLSMLERDAVKQPSPRVLHTLAAVYEVDYIDLMRRAAYIPDDAPVTGAPTANVAFRGASQLSEEQRQRVQRIIDFELSEARDAKRRRRPRGGNG